MPQLLIDLSYTQGEGEVVTGIHLYGKEIVKRAARAEKIAVTLLAGETVDEEILSDPNIEFIYLHEKKNSKGYWRSLSKICDRFERVFFPYQVIAGKLRLRRARLYMTVHDLTPLREVRVDRINRYERLYKTDLRQKLKYAAKCVLRFSRIWYLRRLSALKHNVRLSYELFTVSEYSKQDIAKTFSYPKEKILVVYPYSGNEERELSSGLSYRDFYLLVSGGRYLKNAHMALFALDGLWSEGKETRDAVVTGKLPQTVIKRLRHPEKVHALGYVSDGDLEYLYRNAYCFVFPSLSEGFGLPPAEAMRYGTRVVCSDAMSLKELYGKTVLFDPYSVESIRAAILQADTIEPQKMKEIYRTISDRQAEAFRILLPELLKKDNVYGE